jgi:hypothetical protein
VTPRPAYGLLALLAALALAPAPARARQAGATVTLRGASLADALQVFVDRTGRSVAYDPGLVRDRRSYCVTAATDPDRILACILEGTGLEYFRRASGTYVVGPLLELPAEFGLISGRVVDAATEAPLAGAHVLLADAGRGAAADPGGRFALDRLRPGRYAVTVTHVGYRPWHDSLTVEPNGRTSIRASLGPDALAVSPITVEADLLASDPWLAAAEPIAPRDRADAAPLTDRLASRSGVSLSDVTADIRIEGGAAGDVALRLDGVPLLLPRSLASFVGPLGAPALDRIEVRRAGFEASAGSVLGGMLDFRHALSGPGTADVQMDPYAVSGRVRLERTLAGGRQLQVLASGRHGLGSTMRPPALNRMLREWSSPDPFLVVAPLGRYELATLQAIGSAFGGLVPGEPDLGYDDLHVAARFRTRPASSWDASLHHGARALEGTRRVEERQTDASADGPLFSSSDEYAWRSTMAQVRHETVLGTRTFAEAQAWTSRYAMDHRYRLASLVGVLQDEASYRAQSAALDRTEEGNEVDAWGLQAEATHVRSRHQLGFGLEARWTSSRFGLRLASVSGGTLTETVVLDPVFGEDGAIDADTSSVFAVRHARVTSRSEQFRTAAHASDRITLGRLTVEPGLRLTMLPDRSTVYAEPRFRMSYSWPSTRLGTFQAKLATGLYRQFEGQFDVSTLNAGAFFPSTRIWLPLDRSLRPPRALHLASGLVWMPTSAWTLRVDAWRKSLDHGHAFNYAMDPSLLQEGAVLEQADLTTPVTGIDRGIGLTLSRRTGSLWAGARYERSVSTRRGDALFGGRSVTTANHAPHRASGSVDWLATRNVELGLRGEAAWNRAWAFRQAYYDYFGHDPETATHRGIDLSDPDAHRLPALVTVDANASWTIALGDARVNLRAEIRNVLDRRNELDRQLLWDGEALVAVPKHYPGRAAALALRLFW